MRALWMLLGMVGCGTGVQTRGDYYEDLGWALCESAESCGYEGDVGVCVAEWYSAICDREDCSERVSVNGTGPEYRRCLDAIETQDCSAFNDDGWTIPIECQRLGD